MFDFVLFRCCRVVTCTSLDLMMMKLKYNFVENKKGLTENRLIFGLNPLYLTFLFVDQCAKLRFSLHLLFADFEKVFVSVKKVCICKGHVLRRGKISEEFV